MTNQIYNDLPSGNKQTLGFLSRYNIAAIAVIALLIVAYSIGKGRGSDSWNTRYSAFRDSAQAQANALRDSVKKHVDSILVISANNAAAADSFRNRANTLGRENTRLRTQLASMPRPSGFAEGELPPVCSVCVNRLNAALAIVDTTNKLNANLQLQVDTLERADSLRNVAMENIKGVVNGQRFVIDSLTTTINNMPTAPPIPKLFGFVKVTPTQAFIGGTSVGLLAALLLGGK